MHSLVRPPYPPANVQILTEVQHGRDKPPSDDKLAALEKLLQPLFGLFAHFSHVFTPDSEEGKDEETEEVTLFTIRSGCQLFCPRSPPCGQKCNCEFSYGLPFGTFGSNR
ncbi:hypothetical protein F2P81_023549 [Scophthalmus maximus]|uniref:Uncharacterized protein n=1 Tax=Scophthalmus maximus TaxID=52904 RepID=A0A6A4RWG7_SCOMX|nr:hypothetical protein F2P81_023549 [Scophthalmus maximus]